jgi:hypothetical protein
MHGAERRRGCAWPSTRWCTAVAAPALARNRSGTPSPSKSPCTGRVARVRRALRGRRSAAAPRSAGTCRSAAPAAAAGSRPALFGQHREVGALSVTDRRPIERDRRHRDRQPLEHGPARAEERVRVGEQELLAGSRPAPRPPSRSTRSTDVDLPRPTVGRRRHREHEPIGPDSAARKSSGRARSRGHPWRSSFRCARRRSPTARQRRAKIVRHQRRADQRDQVAARRRPWLGSASAMSGR